MADQKVAARKGNIQRTHPDLKKGKEGDQSISSADFGFSVCGWRKSNKSSLRVGNGLGIGLVKLTTVTEDPGPGYFRCEKPSTVEGRKAKSCAESEFRVRFLLDRWE